MGELSSTESVQFAGSIRVSLKDNCPEFKHLSANLSEATKSYLAILTTVQPTYNEDNPALVSDLETLPKAKGQTA